MVEKIGRETIFLSFIFKYVFVLKDLKFKFKFKFLKKKPNKQINKSIYMYEKLCFQA